MQGIVDSTNLVEHVLRWASFKRQSELAAKSGKQQSKLTGFPFLLYLLVKGIPKLYDANWAGTPKSRYVGCSYQQWVGNVL